MVFLICDITTLSNVFMMIGVRATGLLSLRQVNVWTFGTGMMVDVLRHVGTVACAREVLKMSHMTPESWPAQSFRT